MKDFSNQNLQNKSFVDQDLRYSNFSNSDLRGADFTRANLNGVDFTGIKTGIRPANVAAMFLVALVISLLSGYLAMLTGRSVQVLLFSKHEHERDAGILSVVVAILFIVCAWFVGGGFTIRVMIIPIVVFALVMGVILYWSGLSTGKGMFYLALTLILLVVLFITGTVARVIGGSLSNVLFFIIAISGMLFGKSVGGGIGTIVLAIICGMISNRALSNEKGFDFLRNIAFYITRQFGTSFRQTKMSNTRFSQSKIRNVDFTNTDISLINWGNSQRINCIIEGRIITDKR